MQKLRHFLRDAVDREDHHFVASARRGLPAQWGFKERPHMRLERVDQVGDGAQRVVLVPTEIRFYVTWRGARSHAGDR